MNNWVWWYTPEILALVRGVAGGSKAQGYPWLLRKININLEYRDPPTAKEKKIRPPLFC